MFQKTQVPVLDQTQDLGLKTVALPAGQKAPAFLVYTCVFCPFISMNNQFSGLLKFTL